MLKLSVKFMAWFRHRLVLLTVLSSVVLFATLLVGGRLYYDSVKRGILRNKMHELSSVANLRVAQIDRWRTEHLRAAQPMFADPEVARAMRLFVRGRLSEGSKADIMKWLHTVRSAYQFRAIVVCNSSYKIIAKIGDAYGEDIGAEDRIEAAYALHAGTPTISDIHGEEVMARYPHVDLIVPIPNESPLNPPIGFVMLIVDPQIYLFPLIQAWPTSSQTSETLLVRREGGHILYINELKYKTNTALSFKVPMADSTLPEYRAADGFNGYYEGKDYRGVDVICAIRPVPGFGWGLVAKIDTSEAMAPVVRSEIELIALIILCFFLFFLLSIFMRKREQIFVLKQNIREITKRAKAEESLRESQEQLKDTSKLLSEAERIARIGWYVLDTTSGTWTCSTALDEIFGIGAYHVKDVQAWLNLIAPDYREEMRKYFFDYVLRDGNYFDKEYKIIKGVSGVQRWVHGLGELIRDENGNVVKMIGAIQDITERKLAELALRESTMELKRAKNLETIGMLAAGLAHEVRNPLFAISVLVAGLAKKAPDIPDVAELMSHIKDQTNRLNRIMNDLLVLGKPAEPAEFEKAELGSILRKTLLQMEATQSNSGKRCILGLPDDEIYLMCSPDKLQQVFINLINNALIFSPPDKPVYIVVTAQTGKAIVTVLDEGPGIHPELMNRLFQPFQSKREGGTGLGLAIVRKLVNDLGGNAYGENRRDANGAEFTVILPILHTLHPATKV